MQNLSTGHSSSLASIISDNIFHKLNNDHIRKSVYIQ